MSNFAFLSSEWKDIHGAASKAESAAIPDPRTSCFYARRALELAVAWAYKFDRALKLPYQDSISALIHEPTFKQTLDQLKRVEAQLADKDEKLCIVLADKENLDVEIKRLRKEVAETKIAASNIPDNHNYNEAETRDYFIDLLLKEAGWPLDQKRDREFPVTGMPNRSLSLRESGSGDERHFRGAKGDNQGEGFVDYVLWGDDGRPLGLIEAKRTKRSPKEGEQRAKLYADCLETMFGQRPIVFYSNGYEHWI